MQLLSSHHLWWWSLTSVAVIVAGVPLYALLATLSLPPGPRPGIEPLTIPRAAQQLRESGKTGMALVEAARVLVAERMQYSRRNSFDPAPKAFERGYGYCVQHANALVDLLTQLGFEAEVVQAFRNRFPDGGVGGHAWVRVVVDGESHDIDSLHYDAETGKIDFTPVTKITDYPLWLRMLAGWGCTAANAHRYYVTGKDF